MTRSTSSGEDNLSLTCSQRGSLGSDELSFETHFLKLRSYCNTKTDVAKLVGKLIIFIIQIVCIVTIITTSGGAGAQLNITLKTRAICVHFFYLRTPFMNVLHAYGRVYPIAKESKSNFKYEQLVR